MHHVTDYRKRLHKTSAQNTQKGYEAMAKAKNRITVKDIAREADVSVATVSRIINQSGPVSQLTRERVEAVIHKHSYRPSAIARSLFMKNTKTIGFMIPDITNMFYSQLCLEVEKAALSYGYSVFLCNSMNDPEIETRYLQILQEKQVDGLVLAGGRVNKSTINQQHTEEMKRMFADTPLVMLNGDMPGVSCYKIRTDEAKAVETMIDYLFSLGHRAIGLVGGLSGITSFDIKRQAFINMQQKYGLYCEASWIQETEYTISGGIDGMDRLLKSKNLPTAIIAINDLVALGVIRSCRKNGVYVPDDISVIGFDDIELARTAAPPLTSMAHPYREMGQLAVSTIHALMESKHPKKDIVLETKLVIRDSCRFCSNFQQEPAETGHVVGTSNISVYRE